VAAVGIEMTNYTNLVFYGMQMEGTKGQRLKGEKVKRLKGFGARFPGIFFPFSLRMKRQKLCCYLSSFIRLLRKT